MAEEGSTTEADDFRVSGGEMGRLIQTIDWATTPVGPVVDWSLRLRTTLNICLTSALPMLLWWGQARVLFYNDAAAFLLKDCHPGALGQSIEPGGWAEQWHLWQQLGPVIDHIFATGETPSKPLDLSLHGDDGAVRQFAIAPSSIVDSSGMVEGVLAIATEIAHSQTNEIDGPDRPSVRLTGTLLDITERKQAEQRLQLYADVVNNAQVGVVVWRLEDGSDPGSFRLLLANAAAAEMTGVQFDRLLGTTMTECFPSFLQMPLVRQYIEVVRTGQPHDFGEVSYSVDGVTSDIYSLKAFPLPNRCLGLSFENITVRKQMEVALRQSEERFRQMAETIQDVFWITDFRTPKILYVSPAYEQIWGRSRDDLYRDYATWLDTLHPDDRQRVQAVALTCQHQDYVENEYRIIRPDGTIRWIRDRGFAVRDPAGNIDQVIGIAQDVTEHKSAIEALRRSEAKFRRLVEANIFGVAIGDFSGQFSYANDALLTMIGYTREELEAGQVRWLDLTPPEYLVLDWQAGEELRQQGVCKPFEKEYFHKDGHRIPILIGAALLDEPFEQQEQVIGFYLNLTDLKDTETDRKQAQAALQAALQKLDFHMQNTPLAVIEWNAQLRVTRWSPACERMFGWKAAEILGKHISEWPFVVEDDIEKVANASRQMMEGRVPYVLCRNRNYTKHGSVLEMEWYNSNLMDESGRMMSLLSLGLDVTMRNQGEREREQLLKRERKAREDAETANRIKDEFLAVLSHELRSPLNPIVGWTRLLQSRQFDQQMTKRALDTIERNAKLQTQLIEDLLDVSRILQGKLILNMAPVNLVRTVQAAIETVQLAAEAKAIQIRFLRKDASSENVTENGSDYEPENGAEKNLDSLEEELRSPTVEVLGDAARLQQIVWNLLSNAVKFTPSGGQVEVWLEKVMGHGLLGIDEQDYLLIPNFRLPSTELAQITVKDTGKGINTTFLPHVFDYFRQEDGKTTRHFGGLGLGLAIVRHLVELHGGTVRAESAGEGQGAMFIVRLPLLKTASGRQTSDLDRSPAFVATSQPLQDIRILVVDDQVDMRELLLVILQQYGAVVQAAATATDALSILSQFCPDVLISDIGMPDIDGYMLLRQIRQLLPQQGGQIPAIALTAYAGELNQNRAIAAGFQRHLSKPIEPDALISTIFSLIKSDRQR